MEKEYLERIIQIQEKQLERYHEYVLCALSNSGGGNRGGHPPLLGNNDMEPLFEFIESNLEKIDVERILRYLETFDNNGVIGLLENVMCPDKNNLNFSLQSNQTFVKYKQEDGTYITENVQDFSCKVCMLIHTYCQPYVHAANEEDERETERAKKEDIALDTVCDKNMQRVRNFTNLKFSEYQIRLIKKVFSGLKTR